MDKCDKCHSNKDLIYIGICRNSEKTYYCSKCDLITYIEVLKNE